MNRVADAIERAGLWLAALALVALMGVVVVGVVTRALFTVSGGGLPIMVPGGIELATLGLTALVYASLPGAVMRSGVVVGVFTDRLGWRIKGALAGLYALVYAAGGAVLAARYAAKAGIMEARGDATQDLLIPLWWVYAGLAVACAGLALTATLRGAAGLMGGPVDEPVP